MAKAAATTTAKTNTWSGPQDLELLLVDIATLQKDPRNARKHGERNLEAIRKSLQTFGQRKPIVTHQGQVIAGNGTMDAALALGWTQIAVIAADDLTREQAIAYGIADNKTADLAEWDFEQLSDLLRETPEDLRLATGFADFEIEPLLQAEWQPPDVSDQPNSSPSGKAPHPRTISFSPEQWDTIKRAVDSVRDEATAEGEDATTVPDGRCLELICADYLAGA